MTKRDSTKTPIDGVRAGGNGFDDGQQRREAILNIVDELRSVRDRASELDLGHVVRVIDAAIIATARQVDIETMPTSDADFEN